MQACDGQDEQRGAAHGQARRPGDQASEEGVADGQQDDQGDRVLHRRHDVADLVHNVGLNALSWLVQDEQFRV